MGLVANIHATTALLLIVPELGMPAFAPVTSRTLAVQALPQS